METAVGASSQMNDIPIIVQYIPALLRGALTTVEVSLAALLLATVLGLIVGLARATRRPIVYPLTVAYVETFRSIPLLVFLFLVFFGIPVAVNVDVPAFAAAVIALGVSGSATMAEVIRGAVESISGGQWEAAQSLGMRYPAVVRYVVLPQALRIALPPVVSLYVAIVKDSSLILVVGVVDLTTTAMQIRSLTRGTGTVPLFLILAATYFVLCYSISSAGQWLERRIEI